MKIITINLPNRYFDGLKTLADLGVFESKSHAVRVALKEFLSKELSFLEDLGLEAFEGIIMEGREA